MYEYDIIKILILQFVSFYIRKIENFVSSQIVFCVILY